MEEVPHQGLSRASPDVRPVGHLALWPVKVQLRVSSVSPWTLLSFLLPEFSLPTFFYCRHLQCLNRRRHGDRGCQ